MPLLGQKTGFSIIDWRRRLRAVSALAVVLLSLLALLVVQIWRTEVAQNQAAAASDATTAIVNEAFVLLKRTVDAETGQRGYLLTGLEEYLEPYTAALRLLPLSTERLAEVSAADATLGSQVASINQLLQRRLDLLEAGIQVRRQRGRDAAADFIIANHGKEVMDALRAEVASLIEVASTRAGALQRQADQAANLRATARTALFLVALAAVFLLLFWSVREGQAWREAAEAESRANAELAEARGKAEAAERAKSRFLSAASHDLRQPLHAIRLYIDGLKRRDRGDPEVHNIAERIDMAASSMSRMFVTLLDMSRIEAGILVPNIQAEPLQPILEAPARDVCEQGRLAGTVVTLVPTSLSVLADRELLQSIIENLVCNAAKFSAGKRVLVGARRSGDKVRIEVHDQGPGIPPEGIARIFEEFFQLAPRSRGFAAGLGLGLSIAKRFAEAMGAMLDVRSSPGKGTIFSVTIARAETKPGFSRQEPIVSSRLDGKRILVLDDDAISRDATERVLRDAGAQATAGIIDQGLETALARSSYDLVVLDDNWVSIIGALRSDTQRPQTLVVTGLTDPDATRALAASGQVYLIKPTTAAALTRAAAVAISASRSPQRGS